MFLVDFATSGTEKIESEKFFSPNPSCEIYQTKEFFIFISL